MRESLNEYQSLESYIDQIEYYIFHKKLPVKQVIFNTTESDLEILFERRGREW